MSLDDSPYSRSMTISLRADPGTAFHGLNRLLRQTFPHCGSARLSRPNADMEATSVSTTPGFSTF